MTEAELSLLNNIKNNSKKILKCIILKCIMAIVNNMQIMKRKKN